MTKLEREIPNLGLSIIDVLHNKYKKNIKVDETLYIEAIIKFEEKVEKSLIETMNRLNIQGYTKSDRYSLPYNNEIKIELYGESYLNGCYEVFRVARKIMKEILEKDLYKVRFYMFINVRDKGIMGSVEYCFRYHLPK
jgi:hypothetical protein